MTTQDLIIGHYEETLTETQQAELDSLLENSPEAQTLFEQHGVIEESMKKESEELVPPFGLREATLGAALATVVETIGGGIAAWLSSKIAITVTTVIVGGAAVGLGIALSGDDEVGQDQKTPVEMTTEMNVNNNVIDASANDNEGTNSPSAVSTDNSRSLSTSETPTTAATEPQTQRGISAVDAAESKDLQIDFNFERDAPAVIEQTRVEGTNN